MVDLPNHLKHGTADRINFVDDAQVQLNDPSQVKSNRLSQSSEGLYQLVTGNKRKFIPLRQACVTANVMHGFADMVIH